MKPRYRMRGFLRGAALVAVVTASPGEFPVVRDARPGEIVKAAGQPLLQARGGVFLLDRRRERRL